MSTSILIADDDPVVRHILSAVLEGAGYTVFAVETGQACMETLHRGALPDLLFLDIQLPGMDGLEVLARLRATGRPIPPVLALTALAMEGDRERILGAGADAYLSKPAPLAVLGKEIDRLLATRRS